MKFVQWVKTGKRIFCCLLVFVLSVAQSAPLVYAEDMNTSNGQRVVGDIIEVDGIRYRICDGYAEVAEGQEVGLSGDIVIPDVVSDGSTSYPVTVIGDNAFYECVDIISVEIPDSVMSIGKWAFAKCTSLENVKLPVNLQTISGYMFSNCGNLISIDIPDSVTSIEDSAFCWCNSLKEIKLPKNLQIIGDNTFSSCLSLTSIDIPDSVINIDDYAFWGCWYLEEIKLSENLLSIGYGAFAGCDVSLKMLEIPNQVTTARYAFQLAYVLETAKISDHLTIDYTFYGCTSLETLQIKVTIRDGNVIVPVNNVSGIDGFDYNHVGGNSNTIKLNRKLEFWTEDGSAKLTGDALKAAQKAYMAVEDGNTSDNLWYGWEVVPAYEVTLAVNKDGKPWTDHGRILKLTKDNGSSFVDNLSSVLDGTYQIVDFTENADGINTGVTVEVNGSNVTSSPINY